MAINTYQEYIDELKILYTKYGVSISDNKLKEFISTEKLDYNFQITLKDVKKDYMGLRMNYQEYLRQLKLLYNKYGRLITDNKLQEFIIDKNLNSNFQITLEDVKKDYMEIHSSEIRRNRKSDPIKKEPIIVSQQKQPQEIEKKSIPTCPICKSTDLSKITVTQKAGKAVLFGLFAAGDISKTWKCNQCGSKF